MSRSNPDKIALFDLDGTLADYETAMRRDLEPLKAPEENDTWEMHDNDLSPQYIRERMRLIKKQPGWWETLPRNQIGFDLLNIAVSIGFQIHICTKGPGHTESAWTEKLLWCKRELADIDFQITITMDKSLVYGRVLVDDYIDYVDSWLERRPRGIVIMPLKARHDIPAVIDKSPFRKQISTYNGDVAQKSDIIKRLLEAYER